MHRALIVIASLSLVGCRGDRASSKRAAPADGRDADAGAMVGPRTTVLDPPRVPAAPRAPMPRHLRDELLDAGRGPKRTLRYRLEPSTRTLTATATITSRGYDGGWTAPVTLAPVREGFEVTATATGPLQVRGVVAELVRDGQAPAAVSAAESYLARWRALLERRRADVAIDDRGRLGVVTLLADPSGLADPEAKDELVQRWLGLAVPLPEVAVGLGARWRVVTLLRTGGAVMTQTASYRLTKLERDRWVIEVELDRLGKPQDIAVPGLPAGTTAELIGLIRKVTGTITVSPASPLPLAGQLTAEVKSHARFGSATHGVRDQYSEDQATITLTSPP